MEKSSFFNSISGDRKYKAEEWASYFASFIGNGFFPLPSTGLQVVTGSEMTVVLRPGKAWINGYFYINTADLNLPLAVADGVLSRIDRIVIRWDLTERKISAKVKSSGYASNPTAPALQRDADAYELCVADVLVGKGVTSISQAAITDQRLDPALCGVVAAVVNQIDTTAFNAQLQAWFQDYMALSTQEFNALAAHMGGLRQSGDSALSALETHLNQNKGESDTAFDALQAWFESYKARAQGDFDTWFNNLKSVLDENAATNLLNLITNLTGVVTALSGRVDGIDASVAQQVNALIETVNNSFLTQNALVDEKLHDAEEQFNGMVASVEANLAAKQNIPPFLTLTLKGGAAKWPGNVQTVDAPGVIPGDGQTGTASPIPASTAAWSDANIIMQDSDTAGKVTFICETVPTVDIPVRLVLMEVTPK